MPLFVVSAFADVEKKFGVIFHTQIIANYACSCKHVKAFHVKRKLVACLATHSEDSILHASSNLLAFKRKSKGYMSSHNQYQGYAALPKTDFYKGPVRLDFNANLESRPEGTQLKGFSMRMFVLKERGKNGKDEEPEMSVTLRPEEWLDLIDAMKQEFESAFAARKKFDDLR